MYSQKRKYALQFFNIIYKDESNRSLIFYMGICHKVEALRSEFIEMNCRWGVAPYTHVTGHFFLNRVSLTCPSYN